MIVKERLYLTADRKTVVKDGDKKAAFLFAAAGQEMPDNVARQYGLLKEKKKPENKQVEMPENKQIEISEAKEEDDG